MPAGRQIENAITQGVIWKQLLGFFFPVLLGTLFQQLYNTVDAVVVGRFVGKEALAAVGGSSAQILNLVIGFFTGVSSGAAVIISQYYGAEDHEDVSRSVHTALVLSLAGGLALTALGLPTARWLLELMDTPADTMADSLVYLKIIYVGMAPSMVYNMGSAILRAVGDPKRPLYFLAVCSVVNIVLDLFFVLGLDMGVRGVAVATIIAQTVSALLVCLSLGRSRDSFRLELRKLRPDYKLLRRTVHIGLPSGIQSIMYSLSNMILTAAVNGFGTDAVAGWVAIGKVDALFWLIMNALSVSLMTFSGQNYGARRPDRVRSSVKVAIAMGTVIAALFGLAFVLWGRTALSLFNSDPRVLDWGMAIVLAIAPWYWVYVPIETLSGAFRGLGDTLLPTVFTAVGVCLIRGVWAYTVVPVWHDISVLCMCYPISWALTSAAFLIYYAHARRTKLKI